MGQEADGRAWMAHLSPCLATDTAQGSAHSANRTLIAGRYCCALAAPGRKVGVQSLLATAKLNGIEPYA